VPITLVGLSHQTTSRVDGFFWLMGEMMGMRSGVSGLDGMEKV